MIFWMHFGNCGSLCDPSPILIFPLGIYVELGQKFFVVTLVLDRKKAILEVLIEGRLFVAVSIAWCLNASSTD